MAPTLRERNGGEGGAGREINVCRVCKCRATTDSEAGRNGRVLRHLCEDLFSERLFKNKNKSSCYNVLSKLFTLQNLKTVMQSPLILCSLHYVTKFI